MQAHNVTFSTAELITIRASLILHASAYFKRGDLASRTEGNELLRLVARLQPDQAASRQESPKS